MSTPSIVGLEVFFYNSSQDKRVPSPLCVWNHHLRNLYTAFDATHGIFLPLVSNAVRRPGSHDYTLIYLERSPSLAT